MSKESIFQKYYKKLAGEGLLKSFLLALTVALFAETIILLAFWFVGIKRYWLSIGISVGICAALVPTLYYLFFRPTTKAIAKRLDSLGLEERLLTMNELQNDDSYIAMRQREDAKQALATIDPKNVKIALSKALIVMLIVSFVTAGSMTTVSALTQNGYIPGGNDIIKDVVNPESYYTVRYISKIYRTDTISLEPCDEEGVGGMIEGMDEQLVAVGENGEPVLAVSDPEWGFVCWCDGSEDPYRIEESVFVDEDVFKGKYVFEINGETCDEKTVEEFGKGATLAYDEESGYTYVKGVDGKLTIIVTAYFGQYDTDGEGESGDGLGEDSGQEADKPQEGNPEQGDKEDKKSEESDKNEGDGEPDAPSPSDKDNNNIIDGNTDYKSRLEEYIAMANEYKQNGEKVPDELLELIERYYELIS